MTTITITLRPQPDIARLFVWRESLGATLIYGNGKAFLRFDLDIDDDGFSGEDTDDWIAWCDLEAKDYVANACPDLWTEYGDKLTMSVLPQDAPDWLLEQIECDKWARSARGRR